MNLNKLTTDIQLGNILSDVTKYIGEGYKKNFQAIEEGYKNVFKNTLNLANQTFNPLHPNNKGLLKLLIEKDPIAQKKIARDIIINFSLGGDIQTVGKDFLKKEGLNILKSNPNLSSIADDAANSGVNVTDDFVVYHGTNNLTKKTISKGDFVSLDPNYVKGRYKNIIKQKINVKELIIPPEDAAETINEFIYKPVVKDVTKTIQTVNNSLLQETTKYKTAEEFVKAQPKYKLGLDEDRNYSEALKNYKDGFYPNPEADFYDKLGHLEYGNPLPDKTYEWLDSYTRGTVKNAPSSIIQDDLTWFVPKEPVILYRGVQATGDSVSKVGFRSWTYDKKVAESFAGKDGNVIMQVVEPKDILFDSTKAPTAIWSDLMNSEEMEVIVKDIKPILNKVIKLIK